MRQISWFCREVGDGFDGIDEGEKIAMFGRVNLYLLKARVLQAA